MEKQNEPLSEKRVDYPNILTKGYRDADVKQAVNEAYEELVGYSDSWHDVDNIKEVFKDKFGFELE